LKLPNSFRPDKDLEDKTNQLLEKSYVPKRDNNVIPEDVDDIISSWHHIEKEVLHDRLNDMLRRQDYSRYNFEYKNWDFWLRDSGSKDVDFFIGIYHYVDIGDTAFQGEYWNYHYVNLPKKNVEKFCDRVKRYQSLSDLFSNVKFSTACEIGGVLGTAALGSAGGLVGVMAALGVAGFSFIGAGFLGGGIAGFLLGKYLESTGLFTMLPDLYLNYRVCNLVNEHVMGDTKAIRRALP